MKALKPELLVRKKISRFIEKLFQYQNADISHDRFKSIMYGEVGTDSLLEEKIKNYYDGYTYLLVNYSNTFTSEIFKRFFYILFGSEPPQDLCIRLTTSFFRIMGEPNIHNAISFSLKAYDDIVELDNDNRMFVSLMLLNYSLLKCHIPTVVIMNIRQYMIYLNKYLDNGDNSIYEYLTNIILNNTTQEKTYYKNLIPLSLEDVYQTLTEDKNLLNQYGIEHLSIFGSFAKGTNRIDSDIDLLIEMRIGMSDKEKIENKAFLSRYYLNKFKRFVDFVELDKYLDDKFIREVNKIKKVF